MNAEIVSIGTELLLGEITDTNATWIARQLRDIGVNLFYVTAVGDNEGRIIDTLKRGLERSDLIITTGGLGPTVDDMTRQAVAAATERGLSFHQHLLDQIAARFQQYGITMTENNRQQAYTPENAIIVENPVGTAPSFIVESPQGVIISLPGVPREMKYLMEHSILPYLRQKMGLPAIIKARVLHTAGIGEAIIDDHIKAYMTASNPTVGLAAHAGKTDIRITARAESEAEADAMIAEMEANIRQTVGKYIYGIDGDNNLEQALAARLREHGLRLTICEAGTNHAFGAQLTTLNQDKTVMHQMENYRSVADLKLEMHIETDSLRQVVAECLNILLAKQPQGVGIAVVLDGDGNTALGVKTPTKEHNREIRLGTDAEAAKWAMQWGLGYLWRYLGEA